MGSSHHGDDTEFMQKFRLKDQTLLHEMFNKQLERRMEPMYPEGKLQADDVGALAMRVAADPRKQVVRIEFGKSVAWLGLPKAEALGLADLIRALQPWADPAT